MRLTPPKKNVFWLSVVLVVVGLIAQLEVLAFLPVALAFWLVLVGYALLAAGNTLSGF